MKNLRKRPKIILLIALILVFYFLIHPEYEDWWKRMWIWDGRTKHHAIIYSQLIIDISRVAVATGIALFIENLMYSNKEDS